MMPRWLLALVLCFWAGGGGDLQIRGVTQRVTIPVTVSQRQEAIAVGGKTRLNRRDFGVDYNAFFNPVQDEVDVMFTMVGGKP